MNDGASGDDLLNFLLGKRGFDSPHLHRVLKTFPQVSEGVTCGRRWQLTRI